MPGNPSTPRWAGGVPGGLVVTSAGSLSPLTVHRRYSASAQNRFAADAVASAAESALPGRAQHTNPRGLQLPVLDHRHPAGGGSSIRPSTQPSCPQGRSPDRAVRNPSSIAQTCGPTASISDWCSIFECLWKPVTPSMPLADFSPNCLSSADQRPERLPGDRQPTVHSTLADGSQFVGDLHSGPGVNPKKATSVAASISSGKAWLPPPQEGRSHRLLRSCEFWPLAGAGTTPASSAR